ncbi:TPA: dynamin family protein [Campylobacter jejuni]|nr:dynamin family protein [Campylobacter jejuni]
MLSIQKKYRDFVLKIKDKTQEIKSIDHDRFNMLASAISTKELLIPVVGGFSAGKSSLINQFLEKDILATNLTPETAIATELRFDNENYYEAIKSDGASLRFELDQSDQIKNRAKEFEYLKLYLNNDKLKQIQPLILVDMPGFEAPIADHNKAIVNYLAKGTHFIVLISIEDGNITKSILREIYNISHFGKGFTFCLSKTNLRSQEDINSVKEMIQEQLQDEFDYNKELVLTGLNSGNDFLNLLQDINPESLFETIFKDELKAYYFETESSINTQIATLKSSKEDIEKILQNLKQGIEDVKNSKNKILNRTKDKFQSQNVDSIINSVVNTLINQKHILIPLMNQGASFNEEINSTVKNVVISEINVKIQELNSYIAKDFCKELEKITLNLNATEIGSNFTQTLKNVVDFANEIGLSDMLITQPTLQEKTVGVVLKILEFIFNFIAQQRLQEMIENKFLNEIIPSIKTNLKAKLPSIFQSYIEHATENIALKFEEQIKQKEIEVQISIKEKNEKANEIQEVIGQLEAVKQDLANLANQTF